MVRGSPRGASSHCWHDSHLLGRAERSTPEARRGAPWARGVDGESARRATKAHAIDAPRGSWYRASIFNSLLPGVRTRCELLGQKNGDSSPFWGGLFEHQRTKPIQSGI